MPTHICHAHTLEDSAAMQHSIQRHASQTESVNWQPSAPILWQHRASHSSSGTRSGSGKRLFIVLAASSTGPPPPDLSTAQTAEVARGGAHQCCLAGAA
eukprot:2858309-Rhodomonas_salina.2